jgi:4-carboxymuconolactone decarboxylase
LKAALTLELRVTAVVPSNPIPRGDTFTPAPILGKDSWPNDMTGNKAAATSMIPIRLVFIIASINRGQGIRTQRFRVKSHLGRNPRIDEVELMSIVPKNTSGFSVHNDEKANVVGKYVHEKSGSYYLELGPSGSFVLFQGSEVIGTYAINGAVISLFVAGKRISTAKLENGWIIDDQGDRWVRASAEPVAQPVTPQVERQNEPAPAAAKLLGGVAPKLAQLTEDVLFNDVWEREELSKRDRSLITVAALVAMNRPDQLRFHLGRAVENGVRTEELIEAITHLAFYSGWPNAMTAMTIAKELFSKAG